MKCLAAVLAISLWMVPGCAQQAPCEEHLDASQSASVRDQGCFNDGASEQPHERTFVMTTPSHTGLGVHAVATLASGQSLRITVNDKDDRTVIFDLTPEHPAAGDVYKYYKAGIFRVDSVLAGPGTAQFQFSWCTDGVAPDAAVPVAACGMLSA